MIKLTKRRKTTLVLVTLLLLLFSIPKIQRIATFYYWNNKLSQEKYYIIPPTELDPNKEIIIPFSIKPCAFWLTYAPAIAPQFHFTQNSNSDITETFVDWEILEINEKIYNTKDKVAIYSGIWALNGNSDGKYLNALRSGNYYLSLKYRKDNKVKLNHPIQFSVFYNNNRETACPNGQKFRLFQVSTSIYLTRNRKILR